MKRFRLRSGGEEKGGGISVFVECYCCYITLSFFFLINFSNYTCPLPPFVFFFIICYDRARVFSFLLTRRSQSSSLSSFCERKFFFFICIESKLKKTVLVLNAKKKKKRRRKKKQTTKKPVEIYQLNFFS